MTPIVEAFATTNEIKNRLQISSHLEVSPIERINKDAQKWPQNGPNFLLKLNAILGNRIDWIAGPRVGRFAAD